MPIVLDKRHMDEKNDSQFMHQVGLFENISVDKRNTGGETQSVDSMTTTERIFWSIHASPVCSMGVGHALKIFAKAVSE